MSTKLDQLSAALKKEQIVIRSVRGGYSIEEKAKSLSSEFSTTSKKIIAQQLISVMQTYPRLINLCSQPIIELYLASGYIK